MTDFSIMPHTQEWPKEVLERHNEIVAENSDKKIPMAQRIYELEQLVKDYEECAADTRRLVRDIDVIMNGDGAAQQASLCDLIGQIRELSGNEPDTRSCATCKFADPDSPTCYQKETVTTGFCGSDEKYDAWQPIPSDNGGSND